MMLVALKSWIWDASSTATSWERRPEWDNRDVVGWDDPGCVCGWCHHHPLWRKAYKGLKGLQKWKDEAGFV